MIIRFRPLIWLLNEIFFLVCYLPYWEGGAKIMWWILQHTPADENETK
jgi:hypothetical protein